MYNVQLTMYNGSLFLINDNVIVKCSFVLRKIYKSIKKRYISQKKRGEKVTVELWLTAEETDNLIGNKIANKTTSSPLRRSSKVFSKTEEKFIKVSKKDTYLKKREDRKLLLSYD